MTQKVLQWAETVGAAKILGLAALALLGTGFTAGAGVAGARSIPQQVRANTAEIAKQADILEALGRMACLDNRENAVRAGLPCYSLLNNGGRP